VSFFDIPIESNPENIEQALYDRLAEGFPGWEPAEGNVEVWIARWLAQVVPDLAALLVEGGAEIVRKLGTSILGDPPIAATPATATSTWTMVDDAGYTIPAGTQIEVAISTTESVGFTLDEGGEFPPGTTSIAGIPITAAVPGAGANGVSGDATPVDALAFIESITLDAPTAGGVDAETPEAYLDRFTEELRLQTPRPVIASDLAQLARRTPGVARALAIDGYLAGDFGVARATTVAVIDAEGQPLSGPTKTIVLNRLEQLAMINSLLDVVDPVYVEIDVETDIEVDARFDSDAVIAVVTAGIGAFLSPANWGQRSEEPGSWIDSPIVRLHDLLYAERRLAGVVYVGDTTLNGAAADVDMATIEDFPAVLPTPGTITVNVIS
jgi:hypothetical protein